MEEELDFDEYLMFDDYADAKNRLNDIRSQHVIKKDTGEKLYPFLGYKYYWNEHDVQKAEVLKLGGFPVSIDRVYWINLPDPEPLTCEWILPEESQTK